MKAMPSPINDGPFPSGVYAATLAYLLMLFQTIGSVNFANIAQWLHLSQ